MGQALATLLPLYAFMLVPLWIPLIAVVSGKIVDLVTFERTDVKARPAARPRATALATS